jgi:hypothetical protein
MKTGRSNTISVAVTTVVRAWTRVYTCGMPSASAEQRRADIDSDLWELQHDPDGARGLAPAVQMLGRLFAGIGDDLWWRLERTTLQDHVLMRRAVTLAAATVALSMLWGSAGATPRVAGCPSVPRKPRAERVLECVAAFFEPPPRPPAAAP